MSKQKQNTAKADRKGNGSYYWYREVPFSLLAFVWLWLIFLGRSTRLNPNLELTVYVIWLIFIADFAVSYFFSSQKKYYLKKHWYVLLSLFMPALRLLGLAFINPVKLDFKYVRQLKLIRGQMLRYRIIYLSLLTVLVILSGSASLYFLENEQHFSTYGDLLWWTSMLMTSRVTGYMPDSWEGKLVAFLISLYSLVLYIYLTAVFTSYLISRTSLSRKKILRRRDETQRLRMELRRLTEELISLKNRIKNRDDR